MAEEKIKYNFSDKHSHLKYLLLNRCKIELDKENYENANSVGINFLWLYPDDKKGKEKLIEIFISKSILLINSKKYDDALWLLRMVLSDSPKNSQALREIAYLYIVTGNSQEDLKEVSDINVFFLIIKDTVIICITYYVKKRNKYEVVFSHVIGSGKLSGQSLLLQDIKKYIKEERPINVDFVILKQNGNEYLLYVYPYNKFNFITLKKEHDLAFDVVNYKGEPLKKRKKESIEESLDLDFKLVLSA